jgi:glycosyltransferase
MKISIITCCKNSMPYLSSAINSAKKQTFKNFEHIFIVSSSTDNTENYLKRLKYNRKKIFFYNKGNLYNCINYGIKKSLGEIIFLLHSDDVLNDKNILQTVSKEFKKNIDLVYGNINICRRNNINKIVRKWTSNTIKNNTFLPANLPPHTSLFIKKNVFNIVGDFNEVYRISSDFDFLIRVFKNNKLQTKFINKTIVIMRSGGISSKFKYTHNRIGEDLKILRKYYPKHFIVIYLAKVFNKFIQLLR